MILQYKQEEMNNWGPVINAKFYLIHEKALMEMAEKVFDNLPSYPKELIVSYGSVEYKVTR